MSIAPYRFLLWDFHERYYLYIHLFYLKSQAAIHATSILIEAILATTEKVSW